MCFHLLIPQRIAHLQPGGGEGGADAGGGGEEEGEAEGGRDHAGREGEIQGEEDRALAERVHVAVTGAAPDLSPKTWYGMPAYANEDGKVVLFFKNAGKFKERYSTLGFEAAANLDDGAMWPIAYALTELTAADEARIGALVKKAVS